MLEYKDETIKVSSKEINWETAAHASTLTALICPFGNILGPWLIHYLKGKEMPNVQIAAKNAFNFHMISAILMAINLSFFLTSYIGYGMIQFQVFFSFFLLTTLAVKYISVGISLYGAIRTYQQKPFSYPKTPRFI